MLPGQYELYVSSQLIKLGSVGTGLNEHAYDSTGIVHVQYERRNYSLQVMRADNALTIVFADGTSGDSTYGAGRSLVISDVSEDGLAPLPCAFSDNFPICPVPPPSNRLPFAIEAGERTPEAATATAGPTR